MVALADQLVQLIDRKPVFSKIAQIQFHFMFFQERLGLAATGARRLLQEFDFRFRHNFLSLENGNAGKPPTQGMLSRINLAPYCMDFAPENEMNWQSGSV